MVELDALDVLVPDIEGDAETAGLLFWGAEDDDVEGADAEPPGLG